MLGTPILRARRFACAASVSVRVGELKHCIVNDDAPNRHVPRTLMSRWSTVSHRSTFAQSPLKRTPTPSLAPALLAATITKIVLMIRTIAVTMNAAKTAFRHPRYGLCDVSGSAGQVCMRAYFQGLDEAIALRRRGKSGFDLKGGQLPSSWRRLLWEGERGELSWWCSEYCGALTKDANSTSTCLLGFLVLC